MSLFFPLGPDFVVSSVLFLSRDPPAPAAEGGVRRGSGAQGGTRAGARRRVPQSRRRAPKARMQPQRRPEAASGGAGPGAPPLPGAGRRGGGAGRGAASLRSPARRQRRPRRRELVPTRPLRPLGLARAAEQEVHTRALGAATAEAFAPLSPRPARGACARAGWGGEGRAALNFAGAAACSRGGLSISHPSQSGNIFIVTIHSPQSESQIGGQRHPGDLPGGQTDRTTRAPGCGQMTAQERRAGWGGRGLEGRRDGGGSMEGGWERAGLPGGGVEGAEEWAGLRGSWEEPGERLGERRPAPHSV